MSDESIDELSLCRNMWKKIQTLSPRMRGFVLNYLNLKQGEASELQVEAFGRAFQETSDAPPKQPSLPFNPNGSTGQGSSSLYTKEGEPEPVMYSEGPRDA